MAHREDTHLAIVGHEGSTFYVPLPQLAWELQHGDPASVAGIAAGVINSYAYLIGPALSVNSRSLIFNQMRKELANYLKETRKRAGRS